MMTTSPLVEAILADLKATLLQHGRLVNDGRSVRIMDGVYDLRSAAIRIAELVQGARQ
jgi:hypothetical protein